MPDSLSILLQTASSTTRSGITRLTSFVGLVVLACIPLALTDNQIVQWNPVLFSTAFVLVNMFLLSHDDHGHIFFSPAAIMANYATLTFSIGAFAFSQQLVFENYGANYMLYYELDYLPLATSYFLCCVIASLLSLQLIGKKRPALSISTGMQHVRDEKGAKWIRIVLAVLALAVFSKIDFSIPIWGSGDFSILLCVISALTLAYYARKAESTWRYLLYILLFAYFVVFEIENKRIAIFFAFGLTFLELAPWKEFRINLQFLGRVLGVALAGLLAIISMSIYRGFGQYDVGSIADAVTLVPRYLRSDIALTMLLHNLEGTASYFHSMQAIEVQKSIGSYSYGSTYMKVFFLVVPRSLFPDKPVSMVTLYNNTMYPEFRMGGGSFLPNFYAEGFWNFGFIGGVICIFLIFLFFNFMYNNLIYRYRNINRYSIVKYIGLYTFMLFGFRGAGLDGYLSLGVIIFAFGFLYDFCGNLYNNIIYVR